MARALEFTFESQSFRCSIEKVDRESLYGRVDVETYDRDGSRCQMATLAADGRTLITSGGTGLGYMSADGRWIERSELVPVNASGHRLNTLPSSFDYPLELGVTVSAERFLDHTVRSAYMLVPQEAGIPTKLGASLDAGAIFRIDFSWRGGVNADPAFVLKGGDGTTWLLVGAENAIDFVGFTQAAALDDEVPEAPSSDDLDFEMM